MKMRKKEESVKERSSLRILKAYAVTMVLVFCLCALSCGVLIAQNNTRQLGLGEDQSRVVLSQREDALILQAQQREFSIQPQIPAALDSLLRFSPPPVSALYWTAECVAELLAK